MADPLSLAKTLFNLGKGKALEKPRRGSQDSGNLDNDPGSPGQSNGMFNVGTFIGAIEQSNGFS